MNGRPRISSNISSTRSSICSPPVTSSKRIEVALHDDVLVFEGFPHHVGRRCGIAADAVDARFGDVPDCSRPRAARKADDRHIGMQIPERFADPPGRSDHPAVEFVVRQAASPSIENLQAIGARLHLRIEISDRRFDQDIDQLRETRRDRDRPTAALPPDRLSLAPAPCRSPPSTAPRKIRSAPSHAAGPGSSAPRSRARGRISAAVRDGSSRRKALTSRIGSSRGPSPSTKLDRLAQCVRHDEDIGKQDRGVEAVAADRLQRQLRRRAPACSTVSGTRRPWRGSRGTRADSGPLGASARSAAARAVSPRKGSRNLRTVLAAPGFCMPVIPSLKTSNLDL